MPETLERMPPHNADAEAAVLGACLLDPAALDLALDALRTDDFFRNAHQKAFQAITELHKSSRPVDLVTVQGWLADRGLLESVGGPVGLAGLTEKVASAANVEAYARLVREKSKLRRLIATCAQISQDCYASNQDNASEIADAGIETMHAVLMGVEHEAGRKLGELDEEDEETLAILSEGKKIGYSYGPDALFGVLGPVVRKRTMMIAARPGEGKSAMLLHMGLELAKQDVRVDFVSVEMTTYELKARAAAWLMGLDSRAITEGPLSKEDAARARQAWAMLRSWKSFRATERAVTLERIRAYMRRSIRKYGTTVFLVDYLQAIQTEDKYLRGEERIAHISLSLAQFAKANDVALILAVQVNRGGGEDKSGPGLNHLRGSGQLEQDGHQIAIISADDPNDKNNEISVLVDVRKRRSGPTGHVFLRFDRARNRFEPMPSRVD